MISFTPRAACSFLAITGIVAAGLAGSQKMVKKTHDLGEAIGSMMAASSTSVVVELGPIVMNQVTAIEIKVIPPALSTVQQG